MRVWLGVTSSRIHDRCCVRDRLSVGRGLVPKDWSQVRLQAEALEGDDHRVRPRGPTPWPDPVARDRVAVVRGVHASGPRRVVGRGLVPRRCLRRLGPTHSDSHSRQGSVRVGHAFVARESRQRWLSRSLRCERAWPKRTAPLNRARTNACSLSSSRTKYSTASLHSCEAWRSTIDPSQTRYAALGRA